MFQGCFKRFDSLKIIRAAQITALNFRLVHRFKVEFAAFFDARGPPGCDRFCARIEFERIGAVLVQITKG